MRKINISVNKSTRDALAALGGKDDTFDDIVSSLIHFRNITIIQRICGDETNTTDLKKVCEDVFDKINFVVVPPFQTGDGWDEWESFNKALDWAVEMAQDEDMVGHNREPTLSEAVINVYCLMNDIPSPTTTMGQMRTPF